VGAIIGKNYLPDLFQFQGHDLFLIVEVFPIPGVLGIAPATGKVAQG
jgi:hypothetical protein